MESDVQPYKLSFTTGSQYCTESVRIAEIYRRLGNWDEAREEALSTNVLQFRTASSGIRLFRELAQRLQMLSDEQLDVLIEGSLDEQRKLLWFAICRRYRYIQEFAIEVVREKYLTMDYELTELDYDTFFHHKADWHPELEEIADTTRAKLRQVVFRMLRESGIINEDNWIIPVQLSARLMDVLKEDAPQSLLIYPMPLDGLEDAVNHG